MEGGEIVFALPIKCLREGYNYHDEARSLLVFKGWSSNMKARLYYLRVQVPNNHILAQNLYYDYYYQIPKYPIIGHMDP